MKHLLVILAGLSCLIGFTLLGFMSNVIGIYFLLTGLVLAGIVYFFFNKPTRIISCHFDANTGKFITTVDGIPVDKDSKL